MLIGLRHIYAVAKEKLIPKPPDTNKTGLRARFDDLGIKIFSVPKTEIDKREKQWQSERKKSRQ